MKRLLCAAMAAAIGFSVTACSSANSGAGETSGSTQAAGQTAAAAGAEASSAEETAAASASSNELRIGAQAMPDTLDANASVSNAGIQVYYNIYDTLIMRDTHADEVKFVPGLAESWEQTDELTWEIKLRPNVKFHDGSTMTAEDVAYSMNRVINEEDPSYLTAHSYLLSNFESFEAVDDLTVIAHTIKPEPLFEHLLSDPNVGITSKAYVESVGIDAAALAPVTTAPYKVVSFDPGQEVVLERFDDYWGEKAPFEKVTYTLMPEIISRITALQNGEVDFITNIPPDQEVMLSGNSEVQLLGEVLPMYHIYRFNMSNPITDDPNLRAAMNYAIDRQALVDSIWEGKAEPADSAQFADYGEPLFIADNHDIKYDPELAKELLAQSDYNGETIEIYNQSDYYTYADLAALAVIDMWKEIGINAELVELESQSAASNEVKELRTWSNPLYYVDPMGYIERHWAPAGESANSGDFIPDEHYIEQFEIARYSTDLDERVEAVKELLAFYKDKTPFIYLYKPYESFALDADIQYEIPANVRAYTIGLRAGEISMGQ